MPRWKKNRTSRNVFNVEALLRDVVPLRMYYVRMHDASHELTLTMKFSDYYTLSFEETRLYDADSFSPFIYTNDLQLRKSAEKLYLQEETGQRLIDEYLLEVTCPGAIFGQQKVEERRNEGRSLIDHFNVLHYFHFGVRFNSRWRYTVPGRVLQRIINENQQFDYFRNRNNRCH